MLNTNRNSQIFADAFAAISSPDAIAAHVECRAYWDNQTVEIRLHASPDTPLDWGKYKLHWRLEKTSGVEGIGSVQRNAAVASFGSTRVPMPRVQTVQLVPITLRLLDVDGAELVKRSDDLLVVPSHAAQARYSGEMAVVTTTGYEAAIIRQLNYDVVCALSTDTRVVVTNSPDSELLDWVQHGGKMLFVCEDNQPAFWQYGRGGASEGKWITSTGWLRPEAYPNLKIENPLSLPFQRVMPHGHVGGLPQEDPGVQRDFLAGRLSGWVRRPSIHTVQFGYGEGTVIMTTYALLESLRLGDPDPVGVVMLNDLIDYLVSESCRPVLQVKP